MTSKIQYILFVIKRDLTGLSLNSPLVGIKFTSNRTVLQLSLFLFLPTSPVLASVFLSEEERKGGRKFLGLVVPSSCRGSVPANNPGGKN